MSSADDTDNTDGRGRIQNYLPHLRHLQRGEYFKSYAVALILLPFPSPSREGEFPK